MDDTNKNNTNCITTYNAIFTERFNKLIKNIKKIRRDPTKKDKLKSLLTEAKLLKQSIKESSKQKQNYNITVSYKINEDGTLVLHIPKKTLSTEITIIDIISLPINPSDNFSYNEFTINFYIKPK
jgi:hypothetical protein